MKPEELWDLEVVCPDPERRRLTVAYHEAGHAVVARALGSLCRGLWIFYRRNREGEKDSVLGRCELREESDRRVHYLAAPIAAWRAGRGVFPVAPNWETFLEYGRTHPVLYHDAAVLVQSVTFEDDSAGAYAEAWERATRMVEDLWADIGHVARELDRRGTLTGQELYDLLGATAEYRARLEQVERIDARRDEASRRNRKDNEELAALNSPGGFIWLAPRGYYDDPPNPILLFELENGDHDEDLEPEEIEELAADLRKRLESKPPTEIVGVKPPF